MNLSGMLTASLSSDQVRYHNERAAVLDAKRKELLSIAAAGLSEQERMTVNPNELTVYLIGLNQVGSGPFPVLAATIENAAQLLTSLQPQVRLATPDEIRAGLELEAKGNAAIAAAAKAQDERDGKFTPQTLAAVADANLAMSKEVAENLASAGAAVEKAVKRLTQFEPAASPAPAPAASPAPSLSTPATNGPAAKPAK